MRHSLQFVWLLALMLCGCITPPSPVSSKVVSPSEMKVVVLLDNGRQLALGGRPDLAEKEYRQALKLAPERSNIYNDVGYVLRAQSREDEALLFFNKALDFDPLNFTAQDNRARALYRLGRLEEAIQAYEKLLKMVETTPPSARGNSGEDWNDPRVATVYRNLSTIYYVVGDMNDALCTSATAVALDDSDYQVLLHGRLLLSMEEADAVVRQFDKETGKAPSEFALDRGLALYALKKLPDATKSFSLALSSPDVSQETKKNASLMHLLVATKENDQDAIRLFSSSILEDYPELCEAQANAEFVAEEHYWPQLAIEDVQGLLKKLCPNIASDYVAGSQQSGSLSTDNSGQPIGRAGGKISGILRRILEWPAHERSSSATLN